MNNRFRFTDFLVPSSFKKKILSFLFVLLLSVTQLPYHVSAEDVSTMSHLGVMTWDNTTTCGSISLDGGEFADGTVSADFNVIERTKPSTDTHVYPKTGD
jgi:hypothetical protein